MSEKIYRAGADIGSTTVKVTITDDDGKILFGEYFRTPFQFTSIHKTKSTHKANKQKAYREMENTRKT